jgi:hypothetical protein
VKTRLTWKKSVRRPARESFVKLSAKFWPSQYTPKALVIEHKQEDAKVIAWFFLLAGVFSSIEGAAK